MLLFIQYLIKLSISLAIVWLFYQFVLRKLTFYNSNRWYLLGYTLFCFFIPFIDISPVLQQNEWTNSTPVSWVPVIENYRVAEMNAPSYNFFTTWNMVTLVIAAGMLIMFFRLVFQLISFRRMMRKAKAIPGENINLFQVDEEIIPFSFGNSIFLNQHLHTTEELQEIIRHEFVHVKQKHSIDIIWGELLCLFNWYNPFAWLLKRSMRQNLEFIADNKVLENGIDKKQYQYLLLKVIGNNQFSIAPKFNFSSLKKRIAMMNKLKTARLHLVRFLFILPLLAVILLSFRKQIGDSLTSGSQNERAIHDTIPGKSWNPVPTESEKDFIRRHPLIKNITWGYILSIQKQDVNVNIPGKAGDALMTIHFKNGKWDMYNLGLPSDVEKFKKNYGEEPPIPPPYTWVQEQNSKGNYIDIVDNNGNCTVVVKNEDGKEIDRLLLTKWNENKEHYNNLYGEILPPPPAEPPFPPNPPVEPKLPDFVKRMNYHAESVEIWLKDGKKESYNLKVPAEKAAFEKKYGELMQTVDEVPVEEIDPRLTEFLERNPGVKHLGWVFNNVRENIPVQMHVIKKDGTTETYHLDKPAEKARAEKKYGELPLPASTPPEWLYPPAEVNETLGEVTEISATQELNRANIGEDFEIDEKNARVRLKNGKVEEYNLANEAEKKKFETKYGKIIEVGAKVEGVEQPVKVRGIVDGHTIIVPTKTPGEEGVLFLNDEGFPISGEAEILVTITNKTTQQQLEGFVKQAKEKGIQLQFDNTKYDNGILVHIDGIMKIKGSTNSFSATDFNKLILSRVTDGERIYLKVDIVEKKTS